MTHRTDAVIAGVNKAGTTTLFVALSTHPDIAPSTIKETRYFLPPRYGQPLADPAVWEEYFAAAGDLPVRLEATPSYFYGGERVARAIDERLTDARIILAFREPVARAVSFFAAQKARLRFRGDYPIDDYLAAADRLAASDFDNPENERFMAVRGGCYAEFFPGWLDVFGPDRLLVVDFTDIVAKQGRTLRTTAEWLGLDPDQLPPQTSSSENRTTGYRSKTAQRIALAGNDRLERIFRRHPDVKRKLRAFYYRLNGRRADGDVPEHVRAMLAARFAEPNARFAEQLDAAGFARPSWLTGATPQTSDDSAERSI